MEAKLIEEAPVFLVYRTALNVMAWLYENVVFAVEANEVDAMDTDSIKRMKSNETGALTANGNTTNVDARACWVCSFIR